VLGEILVELGDLGPHHVPALLLNVLREILSSVGLRLPRLLLHKYQPSTPVRRETQQFLIGLTKLPHALGGDRGLVLGEILVELGDLGPHHVPALLLHILCKILRWAGLALLARGRLLLPQRPHRLHPRQSKNTRKNIRSVLQHDDITVAIDEFFEIRDDGLVLGVLVPEGHGVPHGEDAALKGDVGGEGLGGGQLRRAAFAARFASLHIRQFAV